MLQGHSLATQFGHSIVDPVPSLFTFKINDPLLAELAGVIFLCFYTFYNELHIWDCFFLLLRLVSPKSKPNWNSSTHARICQSSCRCASLFLFLFLYLFSILYHEDRFFKFTCFVSRLVQCLWHIGDLVDRLFSGSLHGVHAISSLQSTKVRIFLLQREKFCSLFTL